MINLNKYRTLRPLKNLHKQVNDFIAFDRAVMVEVYTTQFGWGEEDYEADLEQATELRDKIERRIESLSRHLDRVKKSPQVDGKTSHKSGDVSS